MLIAKQAVLIIAFKMKAVFGRSKSQCNVLNLTFTCNFTFNTTAMIFNTIGIHNVIIYKKNEQQG